MGLKGQWLNSLKLNSWPFLRNSIKQNSIIKKSQEDFNGNEGKERQEYTEYELGCVLSDSVRMIMKHFIWNL